MPTTRPGERTTALELDSLSQLADGQAKATINAALAAAVRDTEDRGDDGKPRKVTIEVVLKKVGKGDDVTAMIKAKPTIPPYETKPTVGKLRLDGRRASMEFSPTCADNPDQQTIVDGVGD